jgi:hypothetical protein
VHVQLLRITEQYCKHLSSRPHSLLTRVFYHFNRPA